LVDHGFHAVFKEICDGTLCVKHETKISHLMLSTNGNTNYQPETLTYHDKSKWHGEALSIQLNAIDKPQDAPASHAKNQLTNATGDKFGLFYRNVHALLEHRKSFKDFSWLCKVDEAKVLKPGSTTLLNCLGRR